MAREGALAGDICDAIDMVFKRSSLLLLASNDGNDFFISVHVTYKENKNICDIDYFSKKWMNLLTSNALPLHEIKSLQVPNR